MATTSTLYSDEIFKMRILCYGSSSKKTPKAYLDVARRLGQLIAARGGVCVHGGGASGCMGALHRGCVEADGVSFGS